MHVLNPARFDELLARIRQVRALVVGDLMLDVYLRGSVSRVSPEAPVPVVRVTEEWRALGGAANVACNVVALGASCEVVGCIGSDAPGEALHQELASVGIAGRGLQWMEDRPTTVKTRVLARYQQVARYDREADTEVDELCAAALTEAINELAPSVDVLVLEDYNKGVLVPAVVEAVLEAGRRWGRPVIVDPKTRHFFDYAGATVFKPNRTELAAAIDASVRPDDPDWMQETRAKLGCDHLLITLGEDGMALATDDGAHVRIPALARSVYDVSGAGDTVTAVVAAALAAGATPVEAAILANHAAAIEVTKAGVASVSPDELRQVALNPDVRVKR